MAPDRCPLASFSSLSYFLSFIIIVIEFRHFAFRPLSSISAIRHYHTERPAIAIRFQPLIPPFPLLFSDTLYFSPPLIFRHAAMLIFRPMIIVCPRFCRYFDYFLRLVFRYDDADISFRDYFR